MAPGFYLDGCAPFANWLRRFLGGARAERERRLRYGSHRTTDQQVTPDGWAALDALDARFNTVEQRLGFPAKRRFRYYFGRHDNNTLIIERQWESLAEVEPLVQSLSG